MSRPERQTPPHEPEVEAQVLGITMLREDMAAYFAQAVDPEVFYDAFNVAVAVAVRDLWHAGYHVDATTVATSVKEAGYPDCGPRLLGYLAHVESTMAMERHVMTLRDRASRRRTLAVLHDATDAAYDLATPIEDTADTLLSGMADVELPQRDIPLPANAATFTTQDGPAYEALIPGLMERRDRVILTSAESQGKSLMGQQVAVMAAAGIHPFTLDLIDPLFVLLLDLENSPKKITRALRPMLDRATAPQQPELDPDRPGHFKVRTPWDPDRLRIESREAGVDLLRPVDRAWITRMIQVTRPDLVITGPIYKMYESEEGRADDAALAVKLTRFLDSLRSRFDVAFILEHHIGQGDDDFTRSVRPVGSSVWRRWVDTGIGWRPTRKLADRPPVGYTHPVEVVPWKMREQEWSDWPKFMARGGPWPWTDPYRKTKEEPPF